MSHIDDVFGAGLRTFLEPLASYWEDSAIAAIFINAPNDVWVERRGTLEKTRASLTSEQLYQAIRHIAQLSGVLISEDNPQLHTMLSDGTEISIVLPPISRSGPVIAIHKATHRERTLDEMVEEGCLSRAAGEFLLASLLARQSMVIVGPPGSGKATLIRALVQYVPETERLVSIEQSTSHIFRHPHILHFALPTSDQYADTPSRISQMLLRALGSIRPHRILIERMGARGTLEMMQAFRAGYPGSLATVRAFEAEHALQRIEAQCLSERPSSPIPALRTQIASAFQLAITCRRSSQGEFHIAEIAQILPFEQHTNEYRWLPIFARKNPEDNADQPWASDAMLPTGHIPTFWPALRELGFSTIDRAFFHPENYHSDGERDEDKQEPSNALVGVPFTAPQMQRHDNTSTPDMSRFLSILHDVLERKVQSDVPEAKEEPIEAPKAPVSHAAIATPPPEPNVAKEASFPFQNDAVVPNVETVTANVDVDSSPTHSAPSPIVPPSDGLEGMSIHSVTLEPNEHDEEDDTARQISPQATVPAPALQEDDFGLSSIDLSEEASQPLNARDALDAPEAMESPFHQPDPPVQHNATPIGPKASTSEHQATTVIAQVDASASAKPEGLDADWENVPTHNPTLPRGTRTNNHAPTTQTPPIGMPVEALDESQIVEDTSQILDLSDIIVDDLPSLVSEEDFRRVEEELRQQSPVRHKDPSTDMNMGPSTRAGMLPADELPTASRNNNNNAYLYTDEEPTQSGPSLSSNTPPPMGARPPSTPHPNPPRREVPPHKPARSVVVRRGRRPGAYDIGPFDAQETESTSIRARPPKVPKVSRAPKPEGPPPRNQHPPSVEIPAGLGNNMSTDATVIRGRPVAPKKK